jgi:flagellar M-ring protein FliF
VRNQTQVGGRVRRLSVAVLVDGKMAPNEAGEPVYVPRDAKELAQIESLVRSAIGFDATRGDVVEVKNLPFTAPALAEDEPSWPQLTKFDVMRLAEMAALALVALMLILLVVRPALHRLLPPPRPALAPGGARGASTQAALSGPNQVPALAPPQPGTGEQGSRELALAAHGAQARASLIQQAREMIEEAPDEAVAIIRAWLHGT